MRDLINIIESANNLTEAFRIPLNYAQIVTPDYIEDLINYGFETGHAHPLAVTDAESNYDHFSFERLLEELQEEEFIPEDVDLENPEETRPYVVKWLKLRISHIKRNLSAMIQSTKSGIIVARALAVDQAMAMKLANEPVHLGQYWSFNGGQVCWGTGDDELHIEALVRPNRIDWLTSIRRNVNYVLGEEENEAFLPFGTPVTVIRMWYKSQPIQFKHPNRVT